MDHATRSYLEKQLTREAAKDVLGEYVYRQYADYRHYERYMCGANKTLLLWENRSGQPHILNTFTVAAIEVDADDGFCAKVVGGDFTEHWIDHAPSKLPKSEVFANFPFFPEVTYQPVGVESRMLVRFPLIFRQEVKPDTTTQGVHFLTDVPRFVTLFPQFEGKRF